MRSCVFIVFNIQIWENNQNHLWMDVVQVDRQEHVYKHTRMHMNSDLNAHTLHTRITHTWHYITQYTYISIYTHTYIFTCNLISGHRERAPVRSTHIHMTHTCATHTHTCTYAWHIHAPYAHAYMQRIHTYTCTIYTRIHTHTHAYMHHIHTCMHIRMTHTYTMYTHIHAPCTAR
jgi:hypothetical protein